MKRVRTDGYGLAPKYAKQCFDELSFLQPVGKLVGLLELCQLAAARIKAGK